MGAGASMRALAAKKTSEDILKVSLFDSYPMRKCPHAVPMMSFLSSHE